MNYKIIHPNPTRYAKREKGIGAKAEKMTAPEVQKVIDHLEAMAKDDRDDENPEYPALMINQILWDAQVEALQIWKKIQAERV